MEENEYRTCAHNLTNKLVAVDSKIRKVKKILVQIEGQEELKEQVSKLDQYCQDALKVFVQLKALIHRDHS